MLASGNRHQVVQSLSSLWRSFGGRFVKSLLVFRILGFSIAEGGGGDGAGGSDGGVGLDAQHEPCGVLRRASAQDVPRGGVGGEVREPAFRQLQGNSRFESGNSGSK